MQVNLAEVLGDQFRHPKMLRRVSVLQIGFEVEHSKAPPVAYDRNGKFGHHGLIADDVLGVGVIGTGECLPAFSNIRQVDVVVLAGGPASQEDGMDDRVWTWL